MRDMGSTPRSGRSSVVGNGNLLQYSYLTSCIAWSPQPPGCQLGSPNDEIRKLGQAGVLLNLQLAASAPQFHPSMSVAPARRFLPKVPATGLPSIQHSLLIASVLPPPTGSSLHLQNHRSVPARLWLAQPTPCPLLSHSLSHQPDSHLCTPFLKLSPPSSASART